MEKTIEITFPDGNIKQMPPLSCGQDIVSALQPEKGQLVAITINNELCSLDWPFAVNAVVAPVTTASRDGSGVYRRSLGFLLGAAAAELFPDRKLIIGHSLGYSYFYSLEKDGGDQLSVTQIQQLEDRMKELVAQDLPINIEYVSYKDAISFFENAKRTDDVQLLSYINKPQVKINACGTYKELYYTPLVNRTGLLAVFELQPYRNGFLLRFPATANPSQLVKENDIPRLFEVYHRYKEWGKNINVSTVADLNNYVQNRKIREFVEMTETFQLKQISDIADQIASNREVKVVTIAGPSSSGKTTTSKKLSMQFRAIGYNPQVIELDNYFVGRDQTPKDEKGEYDYECLEALDVPLLNDNLVALFNGDEIELPGYDFKTGSRKYTGKKLRLTERSILILEGIHGLNDKLTPKVPRNMKFKFYLSALMQMNLDCRNRVPTSDNRLIRRIVRDAQFRGKSAADTIRMWPNVQRGERLHIFPYQNEADIMFNTALDYELGVLKVYAEPLLRAVKPTQPEYEEASRMLAFLNCFLAIPATYVPGQSLVREFIGDSDFKY